MIVLFYYIYRRASRDNSELFLRGNKALRILLVFVAVLCIGWWLPFGTLTGTWQLSHGFRVTPRHIRPAPLSMQFFGDGTGMKIDHNEYKRAFEWRITQHGELAMTYRDGAYIIRFRGFGTRMTIENSLRGEWSMGRFDTRSDFTATYRRSFRN